MLEPDALLARLSGVLRKRIAPEVADEYARTQAYMAAVVLDRVARQIGGAEARERAEHDALARLAAGLSAVAGRAGRSDASDALPSALVDAIHAFAAADGRDARGACAVIDALYAGRDALGEARFAELHAPIRTYLRGRLDRQLEYAS